MIHRLLIIDYQKQNNQSKHGCHWKNNEKQNKEI